MLLYIEKIAVGIQFLSYQSKANMCPLNLSVVNENCKSQHTSYMLEMDQKFEQRDLGKNTANEILRRETDGRESLKNTILHSLG